MNTQAETYRTFRRNLTVPALHALHSVRRQAALAARMEAVGFRWRAGRHANKFAEWEGEGFTLRATVADEDGWWDCGVFTVGKFVAQWQRGAIKHRHGDRNSCPWFLPANPGHGHEDYRRACAFGKDWWYVRVNVEAFRGGVKLAEATLCGIDYDPCGDGSHLTEEALDLADQAVREAQNKLRQLCGCH